MPLQIAARSHALGEVQPKLRVRDRVPARPPVYALLVAHVGQHRPPQFALLQAHPKRRQVRRKRFHVMVVVLRIFAQIVARQLARRPRLIKRMAEQVILSDARVQLLKEFRSIHDAPWVSRTAHYTGEKAGAASDGNHTGRQVARMKEETDARIFWGSLPRDLDALHRTFRRRCRRRRPCRMRGRDGCRAHGPEDRPLHPQRRPDRADVVQPRRGRHRQGTPGARSRRSRRNHGRNHRRGRHPVPPAEYFARPRRMVAARPMRQAGLSPEDARGAGVAAESQNQAGGSRGSDRGRLSAVSYQLSA